MPDRQVVAPHVIAMKVSWSATLSASKPRQLTCRGRSPLRVFTGVAATFMKASFTTRYLRCASGSLPVRPHLCLCSC
jgi:hypothetical protein